MPSVTIGSLRIKVKPAGGRWRVILPQPLFADCWMEVAQIGFTTYHDALDCAKAWASVLQAKQETSAIQTTDLSR